MKNITVENFPFENQIFPLNIVEIGNKGHGVAKKILRKGFNQQEYLFYVPGSLKGERVNVRIIKIIKDIIHCELIEIIKQSNIRVKQDCNVFLKCGACTFRHVSKLWINNWKKNNLTSNFNKAGIYPRILTTSLSPPNSRRRASFSLRKVQNNVIIGFKEFLSKKIVNIQGCKTLHPLILELLEKFKIIFKQVLTFKNDSFTIQINLLNEGADVLLIINDEKQLSFTQRNNLISLCKYEKIIRISIKLKSNIDIIYFKGSCKLTLSYFKNNKRLNITPPPGAFLQPTIQGEEKIIMYVLNAIGNCKSVADLFCGSGTLTLPIATNVRVLGVDVNEESIALLKRNINNQLKSNQAKLLCSNLLAYPISSINLKKFDAIIFNPPARGAYYQVKEIAKSQVKIVVGVSCNQTTFIRDAKVLINAGYNIEWIKPIDQFPDTNHIELVAKFKLNC